MTETRLSPLNTNSLRNALSSQQADPHPDADLLNAFAEGMLRGEERMRVVRHLGGCDQCRSVVALVCDTSPSDNAKAPPTPAKRPAWRFAVPALAALAAVTITVVAVRYEVRKPEREAALTAQGVRPETTPTITTGIQPQATSGATPSHEPSQQPSSRSRSATPPRASTSAQPGGIVTPSVMTQQVAPAPAPPEATPMRAESLHGTALPSSQVQARISPIRPLDVPAPAPPTLDNSGAMSMADSAGAFANAATTKALSKAAATPVARAHWRINQQGQPERAFGNGPWQSVLPADAPPMRVLATAGEEVWAGGDDAQVYQSIDGGQTWSKIALPEKNGSRHTIAHIQIDSPSEIAIRASDGTTWTSSNGGASWK